MTEELHERLSAMMKADGNKYECTLAVAEVGAIVAALENAEKAHKVCSLLIDVCRQSCKAILGANYDAQMQPLKKEMADLAAASGCNALQVMITALSELRQVAPTAALAAIAAYAELKAPSIRPEEMH